jgi:hypothetical protein
LIAAGSRGRKLIAVAARGADLVVYGALDGPPDVRGRPRLVLPDALDRLSDPLPFASSLHPRWTSAIGSVMAMSIPGRSTTILTWQAKDDLLWTLRQGDAHPTTRGYVVGFCPSHGKTQIVEEGSGSRGARVVELAPTGEERVIHSDPRAPTGALFGDTDVIAYSTDDAIADWHVLSATSTSLAHLSAPTGTKVIGVHADRTKGASLILLEADARTISLAGRSFSAVVLKASAPIEHAFASPRGGMVTWRTREGWIEVGSVHHRAIVMRVAPEEGA